MNPIPWQELAARANEDGEFRIAARLWTAQLRLDAGEDRVRLRIENGALRTVEPCAPEATCDARIAAPPEEWARLLEACPRPFYQDLFGALTHHGFRIDGDLEGFFAYYPAVRRLVELLREARAAS